MTYTNVSTVVVAEPFSESGLAVLRDAGITVISCVGASKDDLLAAVAGADGLIVRSETRVDRALIEAAPKLAVVGRAGVGVDAIDVDAATGAGIVVLNTPAANTLAATEQTFALMLSLMRKTPDAVASIRAGRWERKPFVGRELAGKTLGIVGLGRIGGAVATRAAAFGMKLLATDPFISAGRAEAFGAQLVGLQELLGRADIVTLHVPLTPQTMGLIDAQGLRFMKAGAFLINCARGGVIDEAALLETLDAGRLAGAAIDVVAEEPPPAGGTAERLHRHPLVVATPHLGGSTHEALERIAIELAHDVATVLRGGPPSGAVNAPVAGGPDAERLRPYVEIAYVFGRLYPQLIEATKLAPITLIREGEIAQWDADPLVASFLSGLLQQTTDRRVSVVNARAIAEELGIALTLRAEKTSGPYSSVLRVTGERTIAGVQTIHGPRIVGIDGFEIDANPAGTMIFTEHRDMPGMIGRVGTILGDAQTNISTMQVARDDIDGNAIMVFATDRPIDERVLAKLRRVNGMKRVLPVIL
jgi:D-3-phosphoglycerate dehydrogenase